MKVFVTGVAGFIGSHVAERMLERGWSVYGCDNLLTGREENVPDGVEWVDVDVTELQLRKLVPDARLIVHCAASYDDPSAWDRDVRTNVLGCCRVAEHGARVLYFQTSLPPVSSYAISKLAGQRYLEVAGVPLVVFRLANVFGPRNLSGPVPAFYKKLTAGEECAVVRVRRDMVYIGDLVDAVMAAVDRPKVAGTIDICSGRDVPIREVFEAVRGMLEVGGEAREVERGPDDVPKMSLDPREAREVLGWEASTGLEAGVAAAVGWYRRHGVEHTYTHLRQVA